MMSEGVRFANEVVMEGAGTKNIVKGAWPSDATHHLNKTNEWVKPLALSETLTDPSTLRF